MGTIESSAIDKLFTGMATADIYGSGSYFEDGIHVVQLKDFFCKEGFKGKTLIAEFAVVSSSNPDIAEGSTRSYVLKLDSPYLLPNTTKLVMALLGYENTKDNLSNGAIRKECELVSRAVLGSDTARAELGAAFSADMLKGVKVKVECTKKQTKPSLKAPAGGVYTDHAWSPMTS